MKSEILITEAEVSDATALTKVCMRSKAHWKYGDAQIEAWKDELSIQPEYIVDYDVYKAEKGGQLIGFYAFKEEEDVNFKLTFLFIDPDSIGQGIGKALMAHFHEKVKALGAKRATLDADPNAEKFYSSFGYQTIGQLPSSIPGRTLPIMEKTF